MSQANGALMRQSPLAVWGWRLPDAALAAVVRADTGLTHPHPVCQEASAAHAVGLRAVVADGASAREAWERAVAWQAATGAQTAVRDALAAAGDRPPALARQGGHVLTALHNAWYQALHAPSFEEGLVATVMGGGDTDTNAAIAGALLGAVHGVAGIPPAWRATVRRCVPRAGDPKVTAPRPPRYWPGRAWKLAVALLEAGDAAVAVPVLPKRAPTPRRDRGRTDG